MSSACRNVVATAKREGGSHAGLLLSRYLRVPYGDKDHPDDRKTLYGQAALACASAMAVYRPAFDRWNNSVKPDAAIELCVRDRMIVGLGGQGVLETGMTLHHTYGVPIIPGSALKGLASHYCHTVWGEKDREFKAELTEGEGKESTRSQGHYHSVLFGTNDNWGKDSEFAGFITFHDAWINPDSLSRKDILAPDIMTPNHSDYYSGKMQKNKMSGNDQTNSETDIMPPSDFDDPNPISFVSLPRGCTFLISVSCNIKEEDARKHWAELALDMLHQALEHWGIGGKTSSGYGHLVEKSKVRTATAEVERTKPVYAKYRPQRRDDRYDKRPEEKEDTRSAKQRLKDTQKKMKKKGFRF